MGFQKTDDQRALFYTIVGVPGIVASLFPQISVVEAVIPMLAAVFVFDFAMVQCWKRLAQLYMLPRKEMEYRRAENIRVIFYTVVILLAVVAPLFPQVTLAGTCAVALLVSWLFECCSVLYWKDAAYYGNATYLIARARLD